MRLHSQPKLQLPWSTSHRQHSPMLCFPGLLIGCRWIQHSPSPHWMFIMTLNNLLCLWGIWLPPLWLLCQVLFPVFATVSWLFTFFVVPDFQVYPPHCTLFVNCFTLCLFLTTEFACQFLCLTYQNDLYYTCVLPHFTFLTLPNVVASECHFILFLWISESRCV